MAQSAYLLMLALRRAAEGTRLATAQVERLRSTLIKGAARVKVFARRVLVDWLPFVRLPREKWPSRITIQIAKIPISAWVSRLGDV